MPILIGPYRLSPEFLEKRKLRRNCTDDTCTAACCAQGVFLTLYDAQRIVKLADQLQPYFAEPFDFSSWDLSRPSYIGTPVYKPDTQDEGCWFLTRNKLCSIHSYALEHGIKVEDVKPYFCRMFPLTLVDIDINVTEIGVDIKAYDTCMVASDEEHYIFEQFETELRRVIGDEGYAQLSAMAK
jgi:Fe-S-cluster containining protein